LAGFYNGAFDAPSRLKGGDLDKNVVSKVGISTSNIFRCEIPPGQPADPEGGQNNDRCIIGIRPNIDKRHTSRL